MNKFILYPIFALLLCQTNYNGVEVVNPCNPVDYVKIVDQINAEVEKKISKRYRFKILLGYSKISDWLDTPLLQFQIVGPLTKEELRVLLIETTKEFLTAINSNEKLGPVLKKYPLPANGIDIGIRIVDKQGVVVYDPDVFLAGVSDGKLYFHTLDEDNPFEYKTTEMEDYETALKIVKDTSTP